MGRTRTRRGRLPHRPLQLAHPISRKGFYLTCLLYGLFAAVSLQKSVRDRLEGIRVSGTYYGLCWIALGSALVLLAVGLWNATDLQASERGFFGMAFALALYAAITVQKNVRDAVPAQDPTSPESPYWDAEPRPALHEQV